jgi:tRNA(His) guanylyltransferase
MACSRFEYTRRFEQHSTLLPGAWAVIRLDGRGFTRFADAHGYTKPNDAGALQLMNGAAKAVMIEFSGDLLLAYGQSDEYSFVCKREMALFGRRHDKILSVVVSLFSSEFVRLWLSAFNGSTAPACRNVKTVVGLDPEGRPALQYTVRSRVLLSA